jgi:hypothetical protein
MRHCRRVPHTTGKGNIRPHEVPYVRRTTELHRSGPHIGPIEVSVTFIVGTPVQRFRLQAPSLLAPEENHGKSINSGTAKVG